MKFKSTLSKIITATGVICFDGGVYETTDTDEIKLLSSHPSVVKADGTPKKSGGK